MPAHGSRSALGSFDTFVVQRSRPAVSHRLRLVQAYRGTTEWPDDGESRLTRRARRQALTLMLGSSLFSLVVLYGVWTLFARVMFSAG